MRRYVTILFVGLAGYVLVPTAPPWMGIDAARITSRAWGELGLERQNMILLGMPNQVAAMPSLHTGIAALVALFAVSRLRSPWRWLLLLYPVAMGLALCYFGEHYVVDEIAGVAVAGLVMLGWSLHDRRSGRERQDPVDATRADARTGS
jgi:membrane-associated phospholipid phosphatase